MGKIKFYADATKMGLPFIKLQEGEFKGMMVLIDTGSNDNIIWGYAYNQMKELFEPLDASSSLYGLDGKMSEVKKVSAKVPFFGKTYEMTFLLREDDQAAYRH